MNWSWSRLGELASVATTLLVAVLGARTTGELWRLSAASDRLLQWDMAKHGVDGLGLACDLRHFDLLSMLARLNEMEVWPPLFGLLEMPVFLIFGSGYQVARTFMGVIFLATVLAAFSSGRQLAIAVGLREWGDLIGATSAVLMATSPMVQLFGTIVMLELPGTLLLLLALGAYLRARNSGSFGHFRCACVFSCGLFFCKFNYGLMWLLPMAGCELWQRTGSLRALLGMARANSRRLARPWPVFVITILLLLAAILLTGPWAVPVGSRVVHIRSLGGIAWALYFLSIIRLVIHRRRWRQWLVAASERTRAMVYLIGLPVAVWMVVPSHTKNFFKFLENRSSGLPLLSVENLAFYPRVFLSDYSVTSAWGLTVLLAGLAPLLLVLLGRRKGSGLAAAGPLLLALLCGLAVTQMHSYKLPRFLFTVAPLIWLSAALLVAIVLNRTRRPYRSLLAAGLPVLLLIVVNFNYQVDQTRLAQQFAGRSVAAAVTPVVDTIAATAAEVRGSVFLGSWNRLSPGLIQWHCYQQHPEITAAQIPQWLRGSRRRGDLLSRLARDPTVERVLILDTTGAERPWQRSYREATTWLEPIRHDIATAPGFIAESEHRFKAAGYVLRVYRPDSPGSP